MDSPSPGEDMAPLQFVAIATPAVLEIRIGGEVDLSNAAELHARLKETELDGQIAVQLDLRDLAFCDGTGAWLILAFIRKADCEGSPTIIGGARPMIHKLLNLLADGEGPIFG